MKKEKAILLSIIIVLLLGVANLKFYKIWSSRQNKFFDYQVKTADIAVNLPLKWKDEFYTNETLENKYRFINFIHKENNNENYLFRYILTTEEQWDKDKHDDNETLIAKANGNILAFGKYETDLADETARSMYDDLDYIKNKSFFNSEYKHRTISVYLLPKDLSNDCTAAISSSRVIDHRVDYEAAALEELFKGVSEAEGIEGYSSIFPNSEENYLKGLKIQENIAYLNLKDIRNIIPSVSASCGSTAFISQVEKTLKQFSHIHTVRFAIEGSPKTFYDWIQTGCQDERICDEKPFKSINL